MIFDVQPFSLHDGPGIRTTVFLKGCPLHCAWCSNPEGISKKQTLSYQKNKCENCFKCVDVCPTEALTISNGKLSVQHSSCNTCGECVKVCPTGALKLIGFEESPEEIIERIKKDKDYFQKSGGGITLSGGEVMLQPDFALSILKMAKEENIHTCIETCGFAKEKDYEAVLPFVDIFLFDYKITNPSDHKKYTRVSNQSIINNLKFLNDKGAKIWLRIPIVPGINDTEEHFTAIAEISNKFEQIEKVELMPYHNWGEHKYEEIGIEKPGLHIDTVSEEQAQIWIVKLQELGCKNIVRS